MSWFNYLKKYSASVVFIYDLGAVVVAWFSALSFFYYVSGSALFPPSVLLALVIVAAVHACFYWAYKTYRPLWRFSSAKELIRLSKAVFFAWLVNLGIFFVCKKILPVPVNIILLYPVLMFLTQCSARLFIRHVNNQSRSVINSDAKRVLLIGAGRGAELFLRDIARWAHNPYAIIASLDDDLTLKGKEIRGVPILGDTKQLADCLAKQKIDLVIIAIPSIRGAQVARILQLCAVSKTPVRVLPSLSEIAQGEVCIVPREVSLEDLLGRDPVKLDHACVSHLLKNQVVLVTGGAGSIGSELCRQILQFFPAQLIIADRSEFNLYEIERELQGQGHCNLQTVLLDVLDLPGVRLVLARHKPTVVFHAAAYKHVPILESQIRQAIRNNVLGTRILAQACSAMGVKSFILISSDKAVNPCNIMGATKRLSEIFCQAYSRQVDMALITVRFGNVIGSAGSVIPLFKEQLAQGGPITVTHPEVKRYFMTIPEAVQLVLQAGALGSGGEIFVLDMGEPVNISQLARQLIQLSGKTLEDVPIVYTGLRPGEKMFEELFYDQELLCPTSQGKIFKANVTPASWDLITNVFLKFEEACQACDEQKLREAISELLGDEYKEPVLQDLVKPEAKELKKLKELEAFV